MGPHESEPVFRYWTPLYGLPAGLLWVVLIVLLWVKSNRNRDAWMVLLPLFVVHAVWLIARQIIPLPQEITAIFGQIVCSLAMTLALLWLLADRIARRRRVATFFLALIFVTIWAALGAFFDNGMSFAEESIWLTVFGGYEAFMLMVGLAVTGIWCRNRRRERGFLLWMIWWFIVSAIFLLILFYAVVMLIVYGIGIADVMMAIVISVIGGTISGVALYLVALPFMILALRNPFYRRRLYDCFRLDWMAPLTRYDVCSNADQLSSSERD